MHEVSIRRTGRPVMEQGRTTPERSLKERHAAVIPHWVDQMYEEPLELVSGQGAVVTDSDGHDYLDAVVQTYSHTKPNLGWSAHAFGRCDVASLQRKYDVPLSTTKFSTCLDLATTLSIGANTTFVGYQGSVTFTSKLIVTDLAEYERLGGNAVTGRIVTIQRRYPGGAWTNVATMAAGAAGTYTYTASGLTTTADWRAAFAKPAGDGIRGATSGVVTVSVSGCSTPPCPLSGMAS